jgi:putative FmdB family regulatory protein
MPTYEFDCVECDLTTEITRTMQDNTPVICDNCSAVMRKVYVPPPIHFRGPDFYSGRG